MGMPMTILKSDFVDSMIDDLTGFAFDSNFMETVTKTASSYDAPTYKIVKDFMKDVSFGVGAALLTLFMLMELVSIIQRSDGDSGLQGIKLPINILIKWGIVTFLFCRLNVVLDAIQTIAVQMATSTTFANTSTSADFLSSVDSIKTSVDSLGLIDGMLAFIIIMICWLVMNLLKSAVSVLMIFRIFEIWIMIMFAPIPLSTLPSSEFRQTAINYIKNFTALSLSGVIIVAAFHLYSAFTASKLTNALSTDTGVLVFAQNMLLMICYLLVLVVTVFNSGKLAKSILNAM
jgi:hypothetical protein